MLTGTLVTIAGFMPIGFAKSGAGEYTFTMFVVIAIALIVSWVVAVLFTPLTGVLILPDTMKGHGGHGAVQVLAFLPPRAGYGSALQYVTSAPRRGS